jgi:ATP-dependent Clp protease protease subunit
MAMEYNPKDLRRLVKRKEEEDEDEASASQNPNPFAELAYETYQNLLDDRIILINGDLKEDLIEKAAVPLMQMAQEKGPIQIYINSYGGSINDSQALVDIMQTVDNPIITMAFGKAMSAGFDIFLAGDYRISYPNTVFMCHSGSASLGAQTLSAINIEAKLHDAYFERWSKFYAARTKISEKEWLTLLNSGNNRYFFPEEALKEGIAHHVVSKGNKPPMSKILKLQW